MTQTIIRMYENEAQGSKAAAELRQEGFENVFKFESAGGKGAAAAKARAGLIDDMAAAHIWKSHAEVYATELEKGGSLVVVYAPFGTALVADRILDAHAPVHKGLHAEPEDREIEWDEAAPLSSLLQIPVLTNTDHPMELVSGFPSLTKGACFLSSMIGLPLLARGRHDATTSLGLPLLAKGAGTAQTSMGLPLLSNSPTPLSSMLGLPVLR
jgi:hypothetical protein